MRMTNKTFMMIFHQKLATLFGLALLPSLGRQQLHGRELWRWRFLISALDSHGQILGVSESVISHGKGEHHGKTLYWVGWQNKSLAQLASDELHFFLFGVSYTHIKKLQSLESTEVNSYKNIYIYRYVLICRYTPTHIHICINIFMYIHRYEYLHDNYISVIHVTHNILAVQ